MPLSEAIIEQINNTLLFHLPPIKSDVGLIFGQGVYSLLLFPEAVKGFAQGRYPKIIMAGGAEVLKTPDAQLLVPFFKSQGVSNDNMPREGEKEADYIFRLMPDFAKAVCVVETESLNTGENVDLCRPLGLDDAKSITIVCAASMSARAIATLRQRYPTPETKPISSIPVYPPGINAQNWTNHPFAANSMTSEFRKLSEYYDQGFLAPFSVEEERNALQNSGLVLAP